VFNEEVKKGDFHFHHHLYHPSRKPFTV